MPPIPKENISDDQTNAKGVYEGVERSAAKAAGATLGYIAGNIPGAFVGSYLGELAYTYRGQPYKVLTEVGSDVMKSVSVPLIPSEIAGIGLDTSLEKVYYRGRDWLNYATVNEQPVQLKSNAPVVLSSNLFKSKRGLGRYRVRRRRYKNKYKFLTYLQWLQLVVERKLVISQLSISCVRWRLR